MDRRGGGGLADFSLLDVSMLARLAALPDYRDVKLDLDLDCNQGKMSEIQRQIVEIGKSCILIGFYLFGFKN